MAVDIADMYESTETTVAEALALAQMAREKALNASRHVSGTCAETTISLTNRLIGGRIGRKGIE